MAAHSSPPLKGHGYKRAKVVQILKLRYLITFFFFENAYPKEIVRPLWQASLGEPLGKLNF